MHFELILSFALIFVLSVNGLSDIPNSSFSRQVTGKCDLTAKPQCSNDCSKILVCVAGIENPVMSINCSPNTPYCDKGQCVAKPGNCSTQPEKSSFVCTSSGLFPEPSNCIQSHYCPEGGSSSIISECPNGSIFDSKLKLCVTRTLLNYPRICQKISCDRVANDFISFPANPAFYAFCFVSDTGVRQTYMYKCDDEVNEIFDLKMKMCRFNCRSAGYFADPLDCNSYYICNGLRLSARHVHCPPNYYFNGTVCLNSKAHCPAGSIVEIGTSTSSTTMLTSDIPTSEMPGGEMSASEVPDSEMSASEMPNIEIPASEAPVNEVSANEMSANELSTIEMPASEVPASEVLLNEVSANEVSANEMSTSEMSTTKETPMMNDQMIEGVAHIASSSFSQSSSSYAPISPEPLVVQTTDSQMDISTKMPPRTGAVWKHMGRLSVRVGRLLNVI